KKARGRADAGAETNATRPSHVRRRRGFLVLSGVVVMPGPDYCWSLSLLELLELLLLSLSFSSLPSWSSSWRSFFMKVISSYFFHSVLSPVRYFSMLGVFPSSTRMVTRTGLRSRWR